MVGEDLVTRILSFAKPSGNKGICKEFADFLDKLGSQDLQIDKNAAVAGLQRLNFTSSGHTLPGLLLLDVLGVGDVDNHFISGVANFLVQCSTDVRRKADKFIRLCKSFQIAAQKANQAKIAIVPLIHAITKLEDSPSTITPIHPLLFQSCLMAECLSAALPCLHPNVCEINPRVNRLTLKDFLLFSYYGGLIYIGRRQYSEALDLLLHALTAPAMQTSAITMAAYKKYVLVSLIHSGRVQELPRFAPSAVTRGLRSNCQEYTTLADNYSKNPDHYSKDENSVRQKIVKDGNEALLDLALEASTKRNILRLTETYMTMPIQQISTAVGQSTQEVELMLLRMIESRELAAKIDSSSGLVSFEEDMSEIELSKMAEKIDQQLQESMHLAQKIKSMSHQVSCEKAFLHKSEAPATGGGLAFA